MNKKMRKSLTSAITASIVTIILAVVILLYFKGTVYPKLEEGASVGAGNQVTVQGTLLKGDGSTQGIASVTCRPKSDRGTELSSGANTTGYFELSPVEKGQSYLLTVTTDTENSYQADLLIYQDNEQQSFYNLFQGIDIAVLSGQDSVQVVLGIDGSGKLTCLSLGTAE